MRSPRTGPRLYAMLRQAWKGGPPTGTAPPRVSAVNAVDGPPNAYRIAADLHAIDDAARLAAAQEALRWVAKNLNDLWD